MRTLSDDSRQDGSRRSFVMSSPPAASSADEEDDVTVPVFTAFGVMPLHVHKSKHASLGRGPPNPFTTASKRSESPSLRKIRSMPELANDDQPPKACLTGIEQSAATKDGSHVRSASLYSKAVEVSGGKSRDRGSTSRTASKADLVDVPIEIKVRGRTIFYFFV
jgi:hypothetical protein